VALGLGLLIGRVGMVSLGQVAVLALGSWVGARLCFATGLPFPIVLILTGLITMVLGTLVGLPALRLSGLYLALITLMLAGAITVVLTATNFPNGGNGFLVRRVLAEFDQPLQRPLRLERRRAGREDDPEVLVVYPDDRFERDLQAAAPEPSLRDDKRLWSTVLVAFPSVDDPDRSIGCPDEVVDHPVEDVRRSWSRKERHLSTMPRGRREVDPCEAASGPFLRCNRDAGERSL